jgi:hypothetical protein
MTNWPPMAPRSYRRWIFLNFKLSLPPSNLCLHLNFWSWSPPCNFPSDPWQTWLPNGWIPCSSSIGRNLLPRISSSIDGAWVEKEETGEETASGRNEETRIYNKKRKSPSLLPCMQGQKGQVAILSPLSNRSLITALQDIRPFPWDGGSSCLVVHDPYPLHQSRSSREMM